MPPYRPAHRESPDGSARGSYGVARQARSRPLRGRPTDPLAAATLTRMNSATEDAARRAWASPRPDGDLVSRLDRRSDERLQMDLVGRLLESPDTRVLDTAGEEVPVLAGGAATRLVTRRPRPDGPRADDTGRAAFLGRDGAGIPYVLMRHPDNERARRVLGDPRAVWADLRECGPWLDDLALELALTGVGLARWHATHRHCPRCGASARSGQSGWVRVCVRDASVQFPRTDPAVIMSVIGPGDRLLLGRGPRFKAARVSVLAGFVEPGERLEDAVVREVAEEVGVVVDAVSYVGSQPWPFPASVMIGYEARTSQERLVLDSSEIVEARWWGRDELASELSAGTVGIAGRLSIARRLIERWYGAQLDQVLEAGTVRAQ